MIDHTNEKLKKVLLGTRVKDVIPYARHIMRLERLKDLATTLSEYVDEVNADSKAIIPQGSSYSLDGAAALIESITAEQLIVEKKFREQVINAFEDAESDQMGRLGTVIVDSSTINTNNLIRNLKQRVCDGAYNYTDDDIIEMMLFSIHLDQWLEENFMEEAE